MGLILLIVLLILLIVGSVVLGVGLYGANELVRRRTPNVRTDPADYGLAYENVEFTARDGTGLRGWFIPANRAPTKGTVIFCHGHAGSMDPDIQYAPWFHQAGYNVLMFDFRGHGRSDGQRVSMGFLERLDLLGAVDYLRGRGIERVGVLGFSMGGVVAMSTAPHCEAIAAVVSDGGFARLERAVAAGARERGFPAFLTPFFGRVVVWLAGLRLGLRLAEADPVRWVDKIAPRALFIIHGGRDPYVSVEEARKLYQRAGEPKELWIVPEAPHRQVDVHCPQEYRQRVLGFFDRWL
ncbi:MAG: alpha/beta fold hydrolase [Anaerolineae bacterium]|nr:alpha/beta fold hydrolase [Anaerolineae bacterium]MDH7474578.1 alpha/beta fold hydrolase [Anaerolineae bacterium]